VAEGIGAVGAKTEGWLFRLVRVGNRPGDQDCDDLAGGQAICSVAAPPSARQQPPPLAVVKRVSPLLLALLLIRGLLLVSSLFLLAGNA
jgi:hypothetical protein